MARRQSVSSIDRSDFVVQELFRYLDKAVHLTLEEEVRTCAKVSRTQPEIGNLWGELIRQVRDGVQH